MTQEKIINCSDKVDYDSLQKRMLDTKDVTDKSTDITTSIKLVDENNSVFMLIEAIPIDFFDDKGIRCKKGCFVKRFEFAETIIKNNHLWSDMIKSFVTAVRYAMIPYNNEYLCRYSYIWAQMPKDKPCIIAVALGLDEIYNVGDCITYVGRLKNNE